jgi:hypothetical protein
MTTAATAPSRASAIITTAAPARRDCSGISATCWNGEASSSQRGAPRTLAEQLPYEGRREQFLGDASWVQRVRSDAMPMNSSATGRQCAPAASIFASDRLTPCDTAPPKSASRSVTRSPSQPRAACYRFAVAYHAHGGDLGCRERRRTRGPANSPARLPDGSFRGLGRNMARYPARERVLAKQPAYSVLIPRDSGGTSLSRCPAGVCV